MYMSDVFEDISVGTEKVIVMLLKATQEHAKTFVAYMKYRQLKAACYGAAKELAGDKPVTDTYLERAVENEHGIQVVEEGKNLFHKLSALETQVVALSSLNDSNRFDAMAASAKK